MDKKDYFLVKPEEFHYFMDRTESELRIHMIGYHNFHHIFPEHFERQQYYHTLHFVVSGKGYLHINGKTYTIYPYDVFYLDDQSTFSYYPDNDEPWEYVFFEFYGPLSSTYAKSAGFDANSPVKSCPHPQKILSMLEYTFKNENVSPSYFSANSLFFLILDTFASKKSNSSIIFDNKDFINEVKHFVQLKYLNPQFNIDYLCQSMHVSHSHLCRIFKQSENITLINYINNIKLSRARELLVNSSLSILEISFKSGYREYEYFLRLFKRVHGLSPTGYRKKYSKFNEKLQPKI